MQLCLHGCEQSQVGRVAVSRVLSWASGRQWGAQMYGCRLTAVIARCSAPRMCRMCSVEESRGSSAVLARLPKGGSRYAGNTGAKHIVRQKLRRRRPTLPSYNIVLGAERMAFCDVLAKILC